MSSGPGQPNDSLADWLLIRPEISWPPWRGARLVSKAPPATASGISSWQREADVTVREPRGS